VQGLEGGSRRRFRAGRRRGRGGLGVHVRGPRERAVEGGGMDLQAGPMRRCLKRASAQWAKTPMGRPHWVERERASERVRINTNRWDPAVSGCERARGTASSAELVERPGRGGFRASLPFSFILNFLTPFPFVFLFWIQIQTCSKFKFK
jgi:hypothetical protein